MIVVDVNLLLYAVVTGFAQHERARTWWEMTINAAGEVGLAAPAIFGFLRLVTNRQVLESPLPVDQAIGHVRDWLARPNVRLLTPGPAHIELTLRMLADLGTAGNLTTDVQLAAFAIEHRGEVYSNDNDFGRFADLVWVNPLRPTPA